MFLPDPASNGFPAAKKNITPAIPFVRQLMFGRGCLNEPVQVSKFPIETQLAQDMLDNALAPGPCNLSVKRVGADKHRP